MILMSAVGIGQSALEGYLSRPNGNGGRTVGDRYYPPLESNQNPGVPDEDDRPLPGSGVR